MEAVLVLQAAAAEVAAAAAVVVAAVDMAVDNLDDLVETAVAFVAAVVLVGNCTTVVVALLVDCTDCTC